MTVSDAFPDGQLRWVQRYNSITRDPPPYHLSFNGKEAVCGVVIGTGDDESNIYQQALGNWLPDPRCTDCQKTIALNLGLG